MAVSALKVVVLDGVLVVLELVLDTDAVARDVGGRHAVHGTRLRGGHGVRGAARLAGNLDDGLVGARVARPCEALAAVDSGVGVVGGVAEVDEALVRDG